jgi:hypothetical protein
MNTPSLFSLVGLLRLHTYMNLLQLLLPRKACKKLTSSRCVGL